MFRLLHAIVFANKGKGIKYNHLNLFIVPDCSQKAGVHFQIYKKSLIDHCKIYGLILSRYFMKILIKQTPHSVIHEI